jgi:hypothetical protein
MELRRNVRLTDENDISDVADTTVPASGDISLKGFDRNGRGDAGGQAHVALNPGAATSLLGAAPRGIFPLGFGLESLRESTSSPLFSTSTHLELDDAALTFTHACKLG